MKPRILIVDDEPNLLSSLKRALRKEPYEVLTAQSATEALDLLKENAVDVVVSDQDMPGMKGTEFLKTVSKKHPSTIRFMLTGKATLEVAVQSINDGAISRFFTKPCQDVELIVSIREALQKRELMIAAAKLLRKVRAQELKVQRLEEKYPGISVVKKDEEGAILMDEAPGDYETLIKSIRATLADDEKDA